MHVSLPQIQPVDQRGREYTSYLFYVGAIFHSSWRYSELERLHQELCKQFPGKEFPPFPPKRWRTLGSEELQQRRIGLETYLQTLFHDESIVRSKYFQEAFIHQQLGNTDCFSSSSRTSVYFLDGTCIELDVLSTSSTSRMRCNVCERCGIDLQFSLYFDLFLAIESQDGQGEALFSLVRKLEDFEAPFVTLCTLRRSCPKAVVLFRKRFWDVSYDRELLAAQRDAIRWMLFLEAVHATRIGWIEDTQVRAYLSSISAQCSGATYNSQVDMAASTTKPSGDGTQLLNGTSLAFSCRFDASFRIQAIRFLALCRKSRFWNSLRFRNCRVRLAHTQTGEQREITADVSIGPREIVFLLHDTDVDSNNDRQQRLSVPSTPPTPPNVPTTNLGSSRELEMVFRIPRIRCWRIQSTKGEGAGAGTDGSLSPLRPAYSFSFEYLFSEGDLRWITVLHDDVLFLKSCLQEIVDELHSRQVQGVNRYAVGESVQKTLCNSVCDHSNSQEAEANVNTTIDSVQGQAMHTNQLHGSKIRNDSAVSISISASTSSSSVSMPESLTSNALANGHTRGRADSRSQTNEHGNTQYGHADKDELDAATRARCHASSVTSETSLSNMSEPTTISIELSRRRSSSTSGSLNPLFRRLSFISDSSRTSRVSDVFEAVGDDEL